MNIPERQRFVISESSSGLSFIPPETHSSITPAEKLIIIALKYLLSFNIANEESSTNVYGDEFMLSDYLQIGSYVQDEYSSGFNYADIFMPNMFGINSNDYIWWKCKICGHIHEGGTLPEDYICPLCKHGASDFEPIK